jgi:hypothetical protein
VIDTLFITGSERHQVIPVTIQYFLDPGIGGDQNVDLTGLDLLDGTDTCNERASPRVIHEPRDYSRNDYWDFLLRG